VHSQKISNALSTSRQYFAKKCLQLTPKNVETQCWIAKTVWQQIPGQRECNSKTPTTKTVQTIARNDQLPLTGRPQMLTTSTTKLDLTHYKPSVMFKLHHHVITWEIITLPH